MTTHGIFWTGLIVIVALAVVSVWRVRREYQLRDTLTKSTSVLVWFLYLLQLALGVYVSWESFWTLPISKTVALLVGIAILVSGMVMMIAAMAEFRSMRRVSGRQVDRLITTGAYRWSRHPQNIGWALAMVGIAIAGRSGAALLLATLFWIMFLIYVPAEERYLHRVFGQAYQKYCARTGRVLTVPKA